MSEEQPQPKKCSNPECRQPWKTTKDFFARNDRAGGLCSRCKDCMGSSARRWATENPVRRRETKRKWRADRPFREIELRRQRDYAISVEDQRRMWEAQSGQCLICRVSLDYTKAHLDHHHESGRVRGFLCMGCNCAIGWLNEDPRRLRRAAGYLEAFNSKHPNPHQLLLNLRKIGGF